MPILLTNDGSLDTTAICSECNETFRGNYAMDTMDISDDDVPSYDAWLEEFLASIQEDHECETGEE